MAMRFTSVKVGLALALLLSVMLLSACGGTALGSLLISEPPPGGDTPITPHAVEGRDGFCLTCHDVSGVSIKDDEDPEATHDGLAVISCTICHTTAWRAIKSTGLPVIISFTDCEECHGVRPAESSPH